MCNKTVLFSVAALLFVAACQKSPLPQEALSPSENECVELTVGLSKSAAKPSPATRADAQGDAAINSSQVFVFREGKLEASSYRSGSTAHSFKLTKGEKMLAAITNHSKLTGISSLDDLKQVSVDLKDDSPEGLRMFGQKLVRLTANTSESVTVSRLLARIDIVKLTNALAVEPYIGQSISLERIFLVNAAGQRTLAVDAPLKWYNEGALKNGECEALLLHTLNRNITAGDCNLGNSFYCYPNDGSSKKTRMVVEAEIGGKKYYYPVTFPSLEANRHYSVSNLRITRLGMDVPDTDADFVDAGVSITVADWDTVLMDEIEI